LTRITHIARQIGGAAWRRPAQESHAESRTNDRRSFQAGSFGRVTEETVDLARRLSSLSRAFRNGAVKFAAATLVGDMRS
jgi:hypothetical protein